MSKSPAPSTPSRQPGVLSSQYRWITIGACVLVFLGAFEALAVTTVMPVVSAALDGEQLYALAFAGPLATGVIGMVVAGTWSDRRGPTAVLYTSVGVFVVGLLCSGLAQSMEVLVAGRFLQGLGSGALTVALYVLVARVFPEQLHPAIFAGFATAWVVPSLVGPTIAGVIAEVWDWRWVFLGVVALVFASLLLVTPVLRKHPMRATDSPAPWAFSRMAWAVLAAVAVLALNMLGALPTTGLFLALAAIAVALLAVRPLTPKGTLSARRGLPTVILVRGLISAAFFGTQVYVPYLLTERYAFTPTLAGLALTGGALAWSGMAVVQSRLGDRLSSIQAIRLGSVLLLIGVLVTLATTVFELDALMIVVAWVIAGAGMGSMSPRLSTLTLAFSTPANQGFNSSAMTVADSFGGALAIAITGTIFAALAATPHTFSASFVLTSLIAVTAVMLAPRIAALDPSH